LLRQCEDQRLELSYRLARIRPAAQLSAWTRGKGANSAAGHPLAWATGAVGLLLMLTRRRRLLSGVGWITGLLALASRATTVLRMIAQLRAIYRSVKETRQK
jgi:hypothetical protein